MADEPARSGSWWATLPGILTATAGVITAATGLLAILAQNGFLGEKNKTFVSEKSAAVRDAVTPSSSSSPSPSSPAGSSTTAAKPAPLAATVTANPLSTVSSPTSAQRESAASGISPVPLHAIPFTGAVVTLLDGSIVKLRDDVREYYAGTALRSTTGQVIEMQRMRRFELSDWRETKGNARITLNSGEVIDVRVEAYLLRGSNDLGDFSTNFDKIRSVEFVR